MVYNIFTGSDCMIVTKIIKNTFILKCFINITTSMCTRRVLIRIKFGIRLHINRPIIVCHNLSTNDLSIIIFINYRHQCFSALFNKVLLSTSKFISLIEYFDDI